MKSHEIHHKNRLFKPKPKPRPPAKVKPAVIRTPCPGMSPGRLGSWIGGWENRSFLGWDSETIRDVQQPLRKKKCQCNIPKYIGIYPCGNPENKDPVRETNRKQESSRMILSTKHVVHCSFGNKFTQGRPTMSLLLVFNQNGHQNQFFGKIYPRRCWNQAIRQGTLKLDRVIEQRLEDPFWGPWLWEISGLNPCSEQMASNCKGLGAWFYMCHV